LAIACLDAGDFKAAYAASLCVLQLAQKPSDRAEGYALLGRCYTACGDADSALSYFAKSAAAAPTVCDLNEHIAAAYILVKDFEAAVTHLEALQKTKLSAEGKAALQYAKSKIS
jgi:tetratricopeptide (TPR) repeat protein